MTLLNTFEAASTVPKKAAQAFITMLSPFAPHLAEHLFETLGGEGAIAAQSWPESASVIVEVVAKIAIQVNGKLRGAKELPVDVSEEQAIIAAREIPAVITALAGKELKRVVYVPGKILNLVV